MLDGETALATAAPEEATAAPASETESTPAVPADPYALLADLDVDELIRRHPRLQGKIGAHAQQLAAKQTQAIKEQMEQQKLAEAEKVRAEYLRSLAAEDPDSPLARAVLEQVREQERARAAVEFQRANREQWEAMQEQMAQGLQSQLVAILERPAVKELYDSGDAEVRRRLDFKSYDSMADFIVGVGDVLSEHRLNKEADKLAKARTKAAEASQKVAEIKQNAERPDLGLGNTAPGTHVYSRSELREMSTADFRRNKAEIFRQEAAGLIRDD